MKPPREKPHPSEKALQAACVTRIRKEWGGEVLNVHGGSPAQTRGTPDLLICLKGRFIAIELKQPGEVPTPLQAKKLRDWAKAGAAVGVATTEVELDALLEEAVRPRMSMAPDLGRLPVCADPDCTIRPMHGPHDFRAG